MTTLILTVAGSDRPGLVSTVADVVDSHGGNWERSQLAELSGVFAGVIEVSVSADHAATLKDALRALDGLLTVSVQAGVSDPSDTGDALAIQVLGNDRPGIVREISAVLSKHDVSIEDMTTTTRDAAMAGGRLFEATVVARVPGDFAAEDLTADLERLATEIQVDVTVGH